MLYEFDQPPAWPSVRILVGIGTINHQPFVAESDRSLEFEARGEAKAERDAHRAREAEPAVNRVEGHDEQS